MYQPPHFKSDDPAIAAELMRRYAFATLVSTDDDGVPFASHLPMHLEGTGSAGSVLWAHCAKPNAQWRHLQARPVALALFLGPHAYQSPKIYPDLARVPSWNYLAVHCKVRASLVEDASAKDGLLKKLIGDHEPGYAQQWRDLGGDYASRMLAGIVGLRLEIASVECKLKLNQHRPESHAAMKAIYRAGGEDERELAGWMDRLGIGA